MNVSKSLAALLLVAALMTGCTTMKRTYEGHPADQVWLAMKTVAQSPQYDDWHVRENDVWVDEPEHRIEIYRRLHREVTSPVSPSLYETREWKLRILLIKDDPPTVEFVNRSFTITAWARAEAIRYFDDLTDILSAPKK